MLLSISFLTLLKLFHTESFTSCPMQLSTSFSILLLLFQSNSGSALPLPTSLTCNVVVGFRVMLLLCGMEDKCGGEVVVRGGGGGD